MKKIIFEFSFEVMALFALIFSMALLWKHNLALEMIYSIIILLYIISQGRKCRPDAILAVIAMVFFPIGEVIMVKSGAWVYTNPWILGVPNWIGLSWACAVLIIKRLIITITKAVDLYEVGY